MFKTLIKYAAAVTAAKAGAQDKAAMSAAGYAGLTDTEKAQMALGSMPGWRAQIDDAAWAGQTWSTFYPDSEVIPELLAQLDEALTPG